ncbi:serine/threonine-protein kinase [Paludisphaera sp.]|uniref:serine/threonine-protein kinase n=1 Tax=Paludisphaera sp. TaxID=2017432 RepID=UPI00301D49D4
MVPDPTDPDLSTGRLSRLVELIQLGEEELRARLDRILREDPEAGAELERLLAAGDAARTEGWLAEHAPRAVAALPPGAWVGPYRVDRVLGRGGMGVVYLARRGEGDRADVALKVMRPGLPGYLMSRFHAERRCLAALVHPGIVRLLDGGDDADGSPYLVMEYVAGEHLNEHCRARDATVEERARLVHSVAETLAFAHRRGVVHRDLKPSNILVGRDGRPRLTDFGLAKIVAAATADDWAATQTATGLLMGTPAYMAPERITGGPGRDDPGVDVYSLGVILFRLLAGRPPFEADGPVTAHARPVREDAPALRRVSPSAPRDLETIAARALARDPRDRFKDAGEMAEQLRRYLAGEPLGIRPPGAAERLARWASPRLRPLLAWGASLAAALVLMIGFQAAWNRQLRHDRDALRGMTRSLWAASTRLVEDLAADEPAVRPFHEELSRSFEAARDRGLLDADPAVDRQVAVMHRHLATVFLARGEEAESLRLLDRAMDLLGPLPPRIDDPAARAWTEFDLFRVHILRAECLGKLGRPDAGIVASDEALRVIRGLVDRFPDEPARLEAEARHLLAREPLLLNLGRPADPRREIDEALRLAERSVALAGPGADLVKLNTLCAARKSAAVAATDPAEKERLFRGARATAERVQALPGISWTADEAYVDAMLGLGGFLLEQGRHAEAVAPYEDAARGIDRLLARRPDREAYLEARRRVVDRLDLCRQAIAAVP